MTPLIHPEEQVFGGLVMGHAPCPAVIPDALESLLEQYWRLAYQEGRDDVSNGDRAQEVLSQLKALYVPLVRPVFGAVGSRDVDVAAGQRAFDDALGAKA